MQSQSKVGEDLLTRRLHLSKGQLVDIEGRLQTRQWDDDGGLCHWKVEIGAEGVSLGGVKP